MPAQNLEVELVRSLQLQALTVKPSVRLSPQPLSKPPQLPRRQLLYSQQIHLERLELEKQASKVPQVEPRVVVQDLLSRRPSKAPSL
jgi:hypothetical protein